MTKDKQLIVAKAIFLKVCQLTEDRNDPIKQWDHLNDDQKIEYRLIADAAIKAVKEILS